MDVRISAINIELSERFHEYVTPKLDKVSRLADQAVSFSVKVSRQKSGGQGPGQDRVEMTVVFPGSTVRSEASDGNKFAAFDIAYARLLERIRRYKDRRNPHRQKHRRSLAEAAANNFSGLGVTPAQIGPDAAAREELVEPPLVQDVQVLEEEDSPLLVRRKVFRAESMTPEEAVDRMELLGHDFYLFFDVDAKDVSVVYRRTGWRYGVISLSHKLDQAPE